MQCTNAEPKLQIGERCLGDLRKCSELYERWLPRTESTRSGPNVSHLAKVR
jgi:hypothetical protein